MFFAPGNYKARKSPEPNSHWIQFYYNVFYLKLQITEVDKTGMRRLIFMAVPTGIEPVLPEWESDVLTARRWDQESI